MLVWETDPSLRDDELGAAFADVCRLSSSGSVHFAAATYSKRVRRWPDHSVGGLP
jgi:hypothetical protein